MCQLGCRLLIQLDMFGFETQQDVPAESQVCKVCQTHKPLSSFPKHTHFKTGIDNRCKSCIRKQSRLREELKDKYWHLRTDKCDCCGETSNKTLVVDHDHDTLEFRGWLCEPCNMGIGKLGDNITGVQKALDYFKRYHGKANNTSNN